MTISVGQSLFIIAVIASITVLTRALPFLVFAKHEKTPEYIIYIGRVLPPAVIGMLIVYCLKNISVIKFPFGIPEFVSALTVAVLHLWKRNNLISILGGTMLYMVLVQFVF